MADIKPFKAVGYGENLRDKLDQLITPPYDVISSQEQEAFYKTNPHNIIRLVLGKQYPTDTINDNRYTRAAADLKAWIETGVLVRAQEPSLTIYQMEFDQPEDGRVTLDGLVALIKVDEYGKGKVLPHEKTYKGPKADQLSLMTACRANLTPIHGLYDDERNSIRQEYEEYMKREPDQVTRDQDGTIHRTWQITDPQVIDRIKKLFEPKSIFIADGHHRYETAMAYKKKMEEAGLAQSGDNHDYVMMYMTSMSHPGLKILPAHRMVKGLPEVDLNKIEQALSPYFDINELPFSHDFESASKTMLERIRSYSNIGGKFGMVVNGNNSYKLLKIKNFNGIEHLMDKSIPDVLKSLDVTILREIILPYGLGMDVDNCEGHIEYTPVVSEALNKALKGAVQVSFILNPTRVDQMRTAAEFGHKLPHKSTYFYPKISSGLVINLTCR